MSSLRLGIKEWGSAVVRVQLFYVDVFQKKCSAPKGRGWVFGSSDPTLPESVTLMMAPCN